MTLPLKLSLIQKSFSDLIIDQLGSDTEIQRIFSIENSQAGDLIFVSAKSYVDGALESMASGIVTTQALANEFSSKDGLGILTTKNVKLAHAALKQEFGDRDYKNSQWGELHPSAVVHDTAKIEKGTYIYPHVTIGENAVIGERTRILSGVVIEEGAHIGNDCLIQPNVVIGYDCVLKNSVEIGAGTVIGSEGFGFAQDNNHKSHRIPQTGNVVIEDYVRIGANNCIDRGTYKSTRIGTGTKTDNICHFAHNVEIGEDCLLTSMFCIAGSSKVGDRVSTSGQTGVLDHVNICSDSVLVHRAGATKDVTEPGIYAGLPLQPLARYMKNLAQFRKLSDK